MITGVSDELLNAFIHFESIVEECFDWDDAYKMGMVAAMYLNHSHVQQKYRRFISGNEIVLANGTYCARDIAQVMECRLDPFQLINGIAYQLHSSEKLESGLVSSLAGAGFVGLIVVETKHSSQPEPVQTDGGPVRFTSPVRFVVLRTALATIGLIRRKGESEPACAAPESNPDGKTCADCNFCNLENVVAEITTRS